MPLQVDTRPALALPLPARTADQHRFANMLHVSKLRSRPAQEPSPADMINNSNFDATQARIQTLLAKLSFAEEQNHALRSRCQLLERELDRVAQSIGSSPTAFRPPRPVMHRCQPRPGDIPPPLRFPSRPAPRRQCSEASIGKTSTRSSGMSSINDLLDSYMASNTTQPRVPSPGSPNFSRPYPNRSVTEGQQRYR